MRNCNEVKEIVLELSPQQPGWIDNSKILLTSKLAMHCVI